MHYNYFKHSGPFFRVSILFILLFSDCKAENGPEPVYPQNNETIVANTPVLAWTPVECDWQEVWINGIKMDSLGSEVNTYVPFALSFGENEWQIVAVKEGARISGEPRTLIVDDQPLTRLPENSQLLRHGWSVKSSALVDADGRTLSSGDVETDDWHSSSLPATALTVLVRNGVYPNPYIATNNMLIPDLNNDFNEKHDLLKYSHIEGENPWKAPYWYVTSFHVDREKKKQQVWLNFNEFNYRAEVWLNGEMLADSSKMVGMERQFRFDVTNLLKTGEENHLAVAVFPVDVPGEPSVPPLEPFGDPGVNMGDGMIAKNYTKWDAVGWDWQPAARDRDMGITEDVFLSFINEVELQDVYITSDPNLPEADYADMVISASLVNHSAEEKQGTVSGQIINSLDTINFNVPFTLSANETQKLFLDHNNVPELRIQNPKLWWPVGYGEPNLYEVKLVATAGDGSRSEVTENHGIRRIETRVEKSRILTINGKDIFLKGGNWVLDWMLNWTASRYEEEILLSKNANQNILRVWGPTGVPPKAFFDAADKHGMLIWQDFLNDFHGTHKNTPGYQPEQGLYKEISAGIVKRYRNHPSLFMWCGGNEGVNPRENILVNEVLAEFDNRSGRFYLKASDGDGLHGGGPYHSIRPEKFFTHPKLHGFSSELGASGVPVLESVRRFIPEIGQDKNLDKYPVDGTWAYHDAANFPGRDLRKFTALDNIIRNDYGGPGSIDQQGVKNYFAKAQLQNFAAYQGVVSSIGIQMWDNSTGMLLWKSNSSWPSMVWQLYDWYQQAHAGYYGAKKAFAPFNIQLNRATRDIFVVNANYQVFDDVSVSAEMYSPAMELLWEKKDVADVPGNQSVKSALTVPREEGLVLLKLEASDSNGNILADNIYWLHPENDFTGLSDLKPAVLKSALKMDEEPGKYNISISNEGDSPALLVQMKLVDRQSKHEILPALWSDNFVTLFPGEKRQYQVSLPRGIYSGETQLIVEPFNRE